MLLCAMGKRGGSRIPKMQQFQGAAVRVFSCKAKYRASTLAHLIAGQEGQVCESAHIMNLEPCMQQQAQSTATAPHLAQQR